jgi:hypothetical protein
MHVHHDAGISAIVSGKLPMTAECRIAMRIAWILAACALAVAVFSSQEAHARDKSLKGELEHALVGQVVTPKILLGDKARPKGVPYDVTVRTLVDAETGEIAYRAEDLLVLAEVRPGEMQHYFATGTSFRITGIHIKGNRIEIKLKELSGGSTEVKLVLEEGWQSRYDAASVQALLARVFNFEQSGQQQMEAGQVPRQTEPVETATPTITPAVPAAPVEAPANQAPVPPNSAVHSEQPEQASDFPIRPAYINCKTKPSNPPFQCGEKVMAIGESPGWVKVRTGENWEGCVPSDSLVYGEPPTPVMQPAGPEAQPDTSAAVAPSQSVESAQPVAQPRTEPVSQPPYSSELPSRFALTSGYLLFAMISIVVALASRQSSGADVRVGPARWTESDDSAASDNGEPSPSAGANGNVPADQYNQAACYLTGCGKKQNPRKAWSLLSASARGGNKEAAAVLAAASVARFPEADTARLDRGSPAQTILLAVVLTAIGCGIVVALMGCLDLWKTL